MTQTAITSASASPLMSSRTFALTVVIVDFSPPLYVATPLSLMIPRVSLVSYSHTLSCFSATHAPTEPPIAPVPKKTIFGFVRFMFLLRYANGNRSRI